MEKKVIGFCFCTLFLASVVLNILFIKQDINANTKKTNSRLMKTNMKKGEIVLEKMQDACDSCVTDMETVVNDCVTASNFETCVLDIVEDYSDLMNDCYPCLCSILEEMFYYQC